MADYGILDDLAYLLAAHAVARGEVVPGAAEHGKSHGLDELIPDPAPAGEELYATLEAIAAIIGDSKFRASLFLNSPVLLSIFPSVDMDLQTLANAPLAAARVARDALEMAVLTPLRLRMGAMDYLLPAVPVVLHHKPSSSSTPFPNLGFSTSRQTSTVSENGKANSRLTSRFSFLETGRAAKSASPADPGLDDDGETPVLPWLIHLFRTTAGLERIMTASVLASLVKAGFANLEREAQIGQIVVPKLCALMKAAADESHEVVMAQMLWLGDEGDECDTYEAVPDILGRLISGSEALQKAAYDNGVIKTASTLLSAVAYTVGGSNDSRKPWSRSPDTVSGEEGHATRLGETGLSLDRAYRVNLREGVLKLIAAMTPLKEEYRKAFAEQDAIGWVVSSLSPHPSKPTKSKGKPKPLADLASNDDTWKTDSIYTNNPKSVIIAACHVVRLLSRSISILRTSLWDYNAAEPLFRLLKHADTDIQRAACGAISNLIVKTSPSRDVSRNSQQITNLVMAVVVLTTSCSFS